MSREQENVVSALVSLCQLRGIKTLIDVGAEDGYEAGFIKEQTLGLRAIAIEGDPRCEPASSHVEYHHALIGADNRMIDFHLHQQSGLSSTLARNDGAETVVNLQQYRLDTFCADHDDIKPDALIIDTEGTTLDVLVGAGDLLDGVNLIYAEVQNEVIREGVSLAKDVDAFLVSKGMQRRHGPPAYDAGCQSNMTWVR